MYNMDSLTALLALSAMAGAIHVIAPDHWFPASTLAWRRGWRTRTMVLFLSLAYAGHLALGYALFWLFREFWLGAVAGRLMLFTIALITVAALIRSYRFSHVEGVIRSSSLSRWRLWTVLALLGPCESIVPILIKGQQMGMSAQAILTAFLAGTWVMGIGLVLLSQRVWDQPELLARWVSIIRGRVAPLPVAGVVAVGLVYFLRLG
jgi:hypothetical protein